eukprot:UN18955
MSTQGLDLDLTTYNTLLVLAHRVHNTEFALDIWERIHNNKLSPEFRNLSTVDG